MNVIDRTFPAMSAIVRPFFRIVSATGSSSVSPVYAADLLGGCVGSLLAGVVLIPLLGLPATALAAAVAIACALLL